MSQYVATVTVPVDAGPQQVADALCSAWATAKVVQVRGLQLKREHLREFFDQVVEIAGTPAAFAEDATIGDRSEQATGERWMEVRFDPSVPNAYRHSSNGQPLHTDGSYVPQYPNATFMYCESAASQGGETTFLDGQALIRLLEGLDSELLKQLVSIPVTHARSGMERTTQIIKLTGDEVTLNWNYYCVRDDPNPTVSQLRDRFFVFLNRPEVQAAVTPIRLQPGEAVAWKDQGVLHGRNAFVARAVSERFIWKCAVDIGVFAQAA